MCGAGGCALGWRFHYHHVSSSSSLPWPWVFLSQSWALRNPWQRLGNRVGLERLQQLLPKVPSKLVFCNSVAGDGQPELSLPFRQLH